MSFFVKFIADECFAEEALIGNFSATYLYNMRMVKISTKLCHFFNYRRHDPQLAQLLKPFGHGAKGLHYKIQIDVHLFPEIWMGNLTT